MQTDELKYLCCDTAIIGAGIAGISAAINLLNNGHNSILIFEAQNRIGGRCYTIEDHGFMELGADLVCGQVENPLFDLALENNLLEEGHEKVINVSRTSNLSEDQDEDDYLNVMNLTISQDEINNNEIKNRFVTQFGEKVDLNVANKLFKLINRAIYMAQVYGEKTNFHNKERPAGEFIYEKFIELVKKEVKIDLKEQKKNEKPYSEGFTVDEFKNLLNGLFLWRCKWENIIKGCINIYNLSLNYFGTYKQLKGSQIVQLKSGYKDLIKALIKNKNEEFNTKLHLQHCLKKILLCHSLDEKISRTTDCSHCCYTKDKNKIVLVITDMSVYNEPKDIIVLCNHVICTMSLGYLKDNLDRLIESPNYIPDEKSKAVSNLGFGTYNKIFLVYDEPFWDKSFESLNLIWMPEDKEFLITQLSHHFYERKAWFEDIVSFKRVNTNSNTLCAYVCNNEEMEYLENSAISKECTFILRKFFGNKNIHEPKMVLRSKWSSNPFVRGSYSQLKLGSNPSDFNKIAEPISFNAKPFIMFAGEATHSTYFSTVHGAYLTGLRESNRVLNYKTL